MTARRILGDGEPVAVTIMGEATVREPDDSEPDRITVFANGIAVDVIANDDGSVYIETYAVESRTRQAVVQHAAIDRYTVRHPSLRLTLADRPVQS